MDTASASCSKRIAARLPREGSRKRRTPDLRVALIGRPNVGKSSILNRLSGFDRSIVDARARAPRATLVDAPLDYKGKRVLLIDTAGIRRTTAVEGELEQASVGRAIETIRRAEVLLLVIDATEGITDQDVRLAQLVDTNDRAMVLVCNKWDAAAKEGGEGCRRSFATRIIDIPFLEFATDRFYLGADRRWRARYHSRRAGRRRVVARVLPDFAC